MENKEANELRIEIIVIDIEIYAREGKEVPSVHHHAHKPHHKYHYIIMVDREKYTVKEECMTGREILQLAGKVPVERFQLNQRFKHGKVEKVSYDQKVCFTEPGIEKFMTIPLDQTEG